MGVFYMKDFKKIHKIELRHDQIECVLVILKNSDFTQLHHRNAMIIHELIKIFKKGLKC